MKRLTETVDDLPHSPLWEQVHLAILLVLIVNFILSQVIKFVKRKNGLVKKNYRFCTYRSLQRKETGKNCMLG